MSKSKIIVKNLSKEFKLPHERHTSLKSTILNLNKRSYETFKVLNDISFEVEDGEFFGVLGKNGSGKSTLLKLLASIYTPTKGVITVNGNLTPFIELGVGFNPELTGRENVYLNGAILGLTQKEIENKYDEIVEFAELERFMDQKLKNYSSGMQVRLAFSIAIQAHNSILLIDEVLAVGDMAFQKKCIDFFVKLKKDKTKTVVFISHDMGAVRRFCDHAVMIDNGRIIASGDTQKVVDKYIEMNIQKVDSSSPFGAGKVKSVNKKSCEIDSVIVKEVSITNEYTVIVKIKANKDISNLVPGVTIRNQFGIMVSANNTKWQGINTPSLKKSQYMMCEFKFNNYLEKGHYLVSVNIVDGEDMETFIDWKNDIVTFTIDRPYPTGGIIFTNPGIDVKITI